MSSEIAIKVQNLSKCYEIYDKPRDRLLQMLSRGKKKYCREFWALRDVSFEIRKGETVGIVGRNGCRVETTQLRQGRTGVEQAGIEEVRTGTSGLQGELTEAQNAAIDGKTNEIALIRLHEKNPKYHGFS